MGSSYVYDTKLNDSPGLELTGKIMVSIMVILFFTILLFIFLHFYFNTFASGRQQTTTTTTHRRRRRHHFVAADHSASATCCRLDPSVLNSIPIVTFGSKDKEMECAVCLSEIVERENIRILPKCNHGFHVDCIDMWFQSNSTCPICRNLLSNEPETKKGNEENLNVFPTNILVFGNQGEEPSSSSSSSSSSLSSNNRSNEMLVIDIPRQIEDEEIKSPIMRQLKSFKKLLSRSASRLSPSSSTDPGKMGSEQC